VTLHVAGNLIAAPKRAHTLSLAIPGRRCHFDVAAAVEKHIKTATRRVTVTVCSGKQDKLKSTVTLAAEVAYGVD
jgi:hypothetical protein